MTEEKKAAAIRMKNEGYTYREIAKRLGVHRQTLYDNGIYGDRMKKGGIKTKYKNIRKFIYENGMNIRIFADELNMDYHKMLSRLNERSEFTKSEIDDILRYTGMTYEECFAKEENHDGDY